MKPRRLFLSIVVLAVWVFVALPAPHLAPAAEPANLTAQPSPPLSSASVPPALAGRLDPQGTRLLSGGNPLCDLWWVKGVPTIKSTGTSPDILYGNLQIGTFVGVIQILAPAEDFRHQKLPPGVYTLRYGQIPQDGNHMGVSQYRDFLLLSPVAADTQLDTAPGFDDLVNLSRKTAGTGHPAVMSLIPASSSVKTLPAVVSDDAGDGALQVNLHEQSGSGTTETPVALVIVPAPKSD
jgi:hypothetical protein